MKKQNQNHILKLISSILKNVVFGVFGSVLSISLFLFFIFLFCMSFGPFWKGVFVCTINIIICSLFFWISEKIRRNKLTVEERIAEDEKKAKQEAEIEKLKFYSGHYTYNNWIVPHATKEWQKQLNNEVYEKIEQMIEATDEPEQKILLLKAKNEMLQEDIKNLRTKGPQ